MREFDTDVAILGGGLAGNFLARQLRRHVPEARVTLLERAQETSYKVGESTVEIASNYMVRRLGLSTYLYTHHLPKNGLRFFTDTAARDAALQEMSEIGTDALTFHPSFQLDRRRLEADLLRMNRDAGVDVHVGAEVQAVTLDGAGHRVRVRRGSETWELTARWVVDGTGRRSLISSMLDLRVPEPVHQAFAVWGRFRGVRDIDALGDEAWRARVRHTARMLSTNHFCYRGYWIWFIPLGGGLTSVGVVATEDHFHPDLLREKGFLRFLGEHRAVSELLGEASLVDVSGYRHVAYGTKRFYDADRWALLGDASAFADPFYSPGSDFIALGNDFVADLIARDLRGESRSLLAKRTAIYDEWMRWRWEAAMKVYRNQYQLLGSFDLLRLRWEFDIAIYYNVWLHDYLRDAHLDLDTLRDQLDVKEGMLRSVDKIADLLAEVDRAVTDRGGYHANNLGRFADATGHLDFVEEIGRRRSASRALRITAGIYNRARAEALTLLRESRADQPPIAPLPLNAFMEEGPLQ